MREGWSGAGLCSASASGFAAAMSTRSCREKAQKQNEQHQAILAKLLREEDNKYCADCEAKGTAGRADGEGPRVLAVPGRGRGLRGDVARGRWSEGPGGRGPG